MPARKEHNKLSKIFLGKSCNRTHAAIDYPFRFMGRRHRILFHDPISAALIGYLANGDEGALSGWMHLAADKCLKPRYAEPIVKILEYAGEIYSSLRDDSKKTKGRANYKLRK